MNDVTNIRDKIKAIGALSISSTAKYIGQTILVTGVTDAAGLIALTGLPKTTVYRAISDYFEVCQEIPTIPTSPTSGIPTIPTDGKATEKLVPPVPPVGIENHAENVVYITTGATKESSSKILSLKKEDIPPLVPQDLEKRIEFENGRLQLFNQLKSYWIEKFEGDEQRLDLALVKAAGYVQANSARPLEAQVSAQLARDVADKRDRDTRYASAVSAKRMPAGGRPGAQKSAFALALERRLSGEAIA